MVSDQLRTKDRTAEIRYHFRQYGVCLQSYGNLVRIYFFRVYSNYYGLSAMFDPHTLGLGAESELLG